MKLINEWMSKKNVTHLLLDGGTLSVNNNDDDRFFESYVRDVIHGTKLCVVEQKTQVFRFFVDVDLVIPDEEGLDVDFVGIALTISRIVNMGKCVLAKASPRKVEHGIKRGLHIIWPESKVTKQKAHRIRTDIVDELGSDWEKVIDPNVYAGSGLRMLWSLKNDEESTPYIPWGYITAEDKTFKEFRDVQPKVEFLRMFSIRTTYEDIDDDDERTKLDARYSDIEAFIRKNVKGQENIRITKISTCKNKKDMWIGTNSRYCENVKRCHKSNHVWFCLSPMGVLSQRCLDDECKNFVGRKFRIPSRLIPNERSVACATRSLVVDYFPDGWKKD